MSSVESPASVWLCPVLPVVDPLIAQVFDRVLAAAEQTSSGLMIVPEDARQTASDDAINPGHFPNLLCYHLAISGKEHGLLYSFLFQPG